MRKVGDILKNRRIEKNLTLDDVEKRTKIRKKFLIAIEKGNYDSFSGSTYLRGFIKNYSEFLNLSSDDLLAIFRREYNEISETKIMPEGMTTASPPRLFRLTPTRISFILSFFFLILLFMYLFKGYLEVAGSPQLIVDIPKSGDVVKNNVVVVSGYTSPGSKLTINNQEIIIGEDGKFIQDVVVAGSTTSIKIVSQNKQGKKTTVERIIQVESRE